MRHLNWILFLLILTGCHPESQLIPPETPAPSTVLPSPFPPRPTPQPSATILLDTVVESAAGTGEKGFQDGPAELATFNRLGSICHDPNSGELYILDTHKVRKLGLDGQITTVAGQEESGFQDGPASQSLLNNPIDCIVDQQGKVYITDASNRRIRLLHPNGEIETVAGTGQTSPVIDGIALKANLVTPYTLDLNAAGILYFSDAFRIRKLDQGQVTTLNTEQNFVAQKDTGYKNGKIQQATFGGDLYLGFDNKDELYISDQKHQVLRKMNAEQVVSDVIGRAARDIDPSLIRPLFIDKLKQVPGVLIIDANRLFIVEENSLTLLATAENIARRGISFDFAFGLSVSPDQWIYVSESGTNRIKRIQFKQKP